MKDTGNCMSCKSFPNSVFNCLGRQAATSALSEKVISLSFKKDQEIFLEGTPMKGVYCVQKGKIKVFRSCHNRNLVVDLAGDSDLIGYSGLFNGNRYTNSAKCLEETQACFIPKDVFLEMLENNRELLFSLLKLSMKENRKITNMMLSLKCTNMLGRISNTILDVADKYGIDHEQRLNVKLTRKDIAEISGTTTESVIRIVNDLKKEHVINVEKSQIKIINKSKLIEYKTLVQ
jgi:CRP-like cAMP-binding protein